MKNLKMFSLGIAMLISFLTFGQERTITGTVSDQIGPLPGASIVIKGTTRNTQSDVDGKYTIQAKAGEILQFSFVGYTDVQVIVGTSKVVNVVLKATSVQLEEVVVTGALGIQKRKEAITYSSQVVKTKSIQLYGNPSGSQAISGKVSGLQVNHEKNTANPNLAFIIRGNKSITSNNQALIVIDDKVSSAEELNNLAPEKIQSINTIKGSQGTALYGINGSNGVVIVNTKGHKPNTALIEIDQEDYESLIENAFESPKYAPLSTFSIDVDNASYTNVRRFINQGQTVPKDAVRVEEMMNFFKYQYPQPIENEPFSINTEYGECPWNAEHKLVKIGLQGKNIPTDDLPASNLVFLIDVSGSMSNHNKLPLLIQSMKILVEQLRKKDKVAIVVYAGAAGMVLPPTTGDEKQTIIAALEKLNAGGSTAGGAGIELAYKIAQENFIKNGNNRVVLATDGDFNVGSSSDKDMETLIEEKRKSGVFLTCLGYGMGNYKDSKMEILADKGNGNYAYIDNIQEANRFLGKEFKGSMFAIAKDVKIQIEFNPKHVQSYRLIGYENRKLRPEDFTNDIIDAGEMGSNHSVTALYEIIPIGIYNDLFPEVSSLKYTKTEQTTSSYNDELATIKFRYKKPDGNKSIEMIKVIENKPLDMKASSDDFKFSSAVAWFGLKLRDSKLITDYSSEKIKKLARLGLSNDNDGYKAEFVRLVEAVK